MDNVTLEGVRDSTAILQCRINRHLVLFSHYCWYRVYAEAMNGWKVVVQENWIKKLLVKSLLLISVNMRPSRFSFVERKGYSVFLIIYYSFLLKNNNKSPPQATKTKHTLQYYHHYLPKWIQSSDGAVRLAHSHCMCARCWELALIVELRVQVCNVNQFTSNRDIKCCKVQNCLESWVIVNKSDLAILLLKVTFL